MQDKIEHAIAQASEGVSNQHTMRDRCLQRGIDFYLDDSANVQTGYPIDDSVRIVTFEAGFEPLIVAVKSYLPEVRLEQHEAAEIAADYLNEIDWSEHDASDSVQHVC